MPPIGPFGAQAIGAGMGLILGQINDNRQANQQKRLSRQQMAIDKEMTDYSYAKQLQFWKDTNFQGQMRELKAAGLNPGLMYGMGGAGGATTGGGAESVGGAHAPSGGGEAMALMGMSMQQRMMEAQIELAKSQANKNNVETTKTAGVDTQEAETRIKSLMQGITNQQTQQKLMEVEVYLKELDKVFQAESLSDRLDQVEYNAKRAATELENAQTTTYINKATREEQIKIVKETAIGAVLRNALTSAQTANTQQSTVESQARVKQISEQILQEWTKITQSSEQLTIEKQKVLLQAAMNKFLQEHPGWSQVIGGAADKGVKLVDEITEAIRNILNPFNKK